VTQDNVPRLATKKQLYQAAIRCRRTARKRTHLHI